MAKSARLSERTTVQLHADCVEIVQRDAINERVSQSITLTHETAEKLIPILHRFVGVEPKRTKRPVT